MFYKYLGFLLVLLGLQEDILAQEDLTINARIFNDSGLKHYVGCQFSSVSDADVGHGAIIAPNFFDKHAQLPPQLVIRSENQFLSSSTTSTIIQGMATVDAFIDVLGSHDIPPKIKLEFFSSGLPENERQWIQNNTRILNDLAIRDDIKVVMIVDDYPRYFNTILSGKKESISFYNALKRLLNSKKLVVMGAGDNGGKFGEDHNLSDFCSFMKSMENSSRLILVGATKYQDGKEVITKFSRTAGSLSDNYLTAPGEEIKCSWPHFHTRDPGSITATTTVSGTYLSASIVSAALLTLINEFPELTIDEVSNLMFKSALKEEEHKDIYGQGFLDVDATRLLCHELTQAKNQERQNYGKVEVDFLEIPYIKSESWGKVITQKSPKFQQFWVKKEEFDRCQDDLGNVEKIYFPESIAPYRLFNDGGNSGLFQVCYIPISDVSAGNLQYFNIKDELPDEVIQTISGVIVGYQYHHSKDGIYFTIPPWVDE